MTKKPSLVNLIILFESTYILYTQNVITGHNYINDQLSFTLINKYNMNNLVNNYGIMWGGGGRSKKKKGTSNITLTLKINEAVKAVAKLTKFN